LLQSDYNPDIISTLARTADILREEDDYLDSLSGDLAHRLIHRESGGWSLAIPAVRVLPAALQRRLLRVFLDRAAPDSPPQDYRTTRQLEALVEEGRHGTAVTLSPGLRVRVLYSDLTVTPGAFEYKMERVPLPIPGEAALPDLGLKLRAQQADVTEAGNPKTDACGERAILDADVLPGPLMVRQRRKGDLFRPLGCPGEAKLKAFLIDRKVPRPERDRIPLVVSGGKIAWVVGYQIDDRFKVTPQTRHVLILSKELS
jgi:tRNA(Ile)-lysidine synthase